MINESIGLPRRIQMARRPHTPPANRQRNALLDAATDTASALSAARRHTSDRASQGCFVGSRLADYRGTMLGVVEEALLSLEAEQAVVAHLVLVELAQRGRIGPARWT